MEELAVVTKAQALKHPNWSMGGENHDRLGVDDEQGVRDDRGEVAVRGYAGTDTGRGASAVGDPFDGSV